MKRAVLTIVLSVPLGACQNFGVAARIDPPKVATYESAKCEASSDQDKKSGKKGKRDNPINLDCFTLPDQVGVTRLMSFNPKEIRARRAPDDAAPVATTATVIDERPAVPLTAYDAAVTDAVARNRLTSALLKHSDDQCVRDSAMVVGNQSAANLILDLLTTGLTSAATIVTGDKADTILTGVGAFTSGSRSHINADIYRGQFTEAITSAIAGEQARLRSMIDQKRGASTAEYTVDDAVRDVNEYYQACSFYKGLEILLKSAQGYPKLVEEQEREQARRDIAPLQQELEKRRAEFVALAGKPGSDKLLPGVQKQIDYYEALVAQRTSVALKAPAAPDDAPDESPVP